jgi:hypothetical protein
LVFAVLALAVGPFGAPAAAPALTAAAAAPLSASPGQGGAVPALAVIRNQNHLSERPLAPVQTPGYSPAALRSAYNVVKASAAGGRGETVAVVSAYRDPDAAANLAVYRSHYKLGACTVASGCLRIRNEHGGTGGLPAANSTWAMLQTVQLDAISALCPKCRLLLVEAASTSVTDLGTAENAAVAAGARFDANGWGMLEFTGDDSYARYFDHPGSAIVFAAGGNGYASTFPAALQYVTAVGGTTLTRSAFNSRGWAEVPWAKTGSRCAILAAKPSWQRADATAGTGCLNRTENDVAADADPATGISVYDTYGSNGWTKAGGAGLAAAIVTAVYALAGTPAAGSYPASYPYQHAGRLYDVSGGPVGDCPPVREYLCTAEHGYDGPTGLGTPDGTAAFAAAGTDPVTVVDPGTRDLLAGAGVTIRVTGLDSRAGSTSLAYKAAGLPAGLSVKASGKSAVITGTLPAAAGSHAVTLTARDTRTGKTGSTRFTIVAAGSLTPATPVTGLISLGPTSFAGQQAGRYCMDSGAGTAGTVVTVATCTGTAGQLFSYQPEGAPGAADNLVIDGLCVAPASGGVKLAACVRGSAVQGWRLEPGGVLADTGTGTCLTTPDTGVNPLRLAVCGSAPADQQFSLGAVKLTSGVTGMCVSVNDDGFHTAPYTLEPCAQSHGFYLSDTGTVASSLGRCMNEGPASANCDGTVDQDWLWSAGGELVNESAGLCLDDPGNSAAAGTGLTLSDCYGQPGEIWAAA